MSKYEVILYWREDDRSYIAEVPELPGCMADGATYREALEKAEIVIQEVDRNGDRGREADPGTQRPFVVRLTAGD